MKSLVASLSWATPLLCAASAFGLLLAPAPAQGQTPGGPTGPRYDWQYATYLGPSQTAQVGAGQVLLGGVATDPAGNVVVGGSFQPTLSFDNDQRELQTPYPLSSIQTNGFVARYTSGGILTWTLDVVGAGQVAAVGTDATGNVYATGDYWSTISFNNLLPLTGGTSFLVKISPAGVPLWTRNVASSPRNYGSQDWQLATDAAGNCAVQGDFVGSAVLGSQTFSSTSASAYNPFIARFSTSGTMLSAWAGQQTGVNFVPRDRDSFGLALAPNGEVYYSAWIFRQGSLAIGNGLAAISAGPTATARGFLLKINPLGSAEWVLTANIDDVAISAMQYSPASGYVYAVIGSRNNFTLANESFAYSTANQGVYIAQIRPDGTLKKSIFGGVETMPSLSLGRNDDLYLGFLAGSPRWGAVQLTPPATAADQTIGVIRLDSAGTALGGWQATGPAVVRTPKLAVDGQGQAVYAGAVVAGRVAFQFGSRTVAAPNAFGIYVARTSARPLAARAAREVAGLALYPNPNSGEVFVRLAQPGAVALEVRDALGRLVAQPTLSAGQSRFVLPAGLAAGTYLVRVAQGDAVSFRRLSVAP